MSISCVRAKEVVCRVAVRVLSEFDFHRLAICGGGRSRGQSARERVSGGSAGSGVRQTSKTDSARQPGPVLRAPGRTPVLSARRRWVPPSSLRRHDVPDAEAKHDTIFRKVRGILNKLTPEKFQKLSDDLLALELDSDKVLKGVILLIFEKALDEPKYSSMYAQLCKRLSEEAPNFEPAGQPCTFKLLLLNKCRTEFENRAQAFAAFEDRQLAPEDEERRHLAKCKMLGNIKFIGELGKLEILAESILHRCIQNLLARRAAAEHHEDLECLAQLVRTCGRVLDSERGRGLMEQYFARIDTLAASRELAPRIRFMLRDVAELRRGGWVPRAANAPEGPVPIQQLRGDEEPPPRRDLFRAPQRRPLDDVLAGLSLAPPTAPLLPPPPDKLFPNGFGSRDAFRQRSAPGYFPRYSKAGKQEAPRPHKSRLAASAALEDVQMRPGAYSLMYTANRLSKPQPTPMPLAQQNVLTPAFSSAPSLIKEPAITIKPAPDKKDKPKKDKGMSKEEACRVAVEALEQLTREMEESGAASGELRDEPELAESSQHARRLQELQLPDKLLRRAVAAVLERCVAMESGAAVAAACVLLRGVKRAALGEPLRALLAAAGPRRAALLAAMAHARLLPLADAAALAEPALLLDTLQELAQRVPPPRLQQLYLDSKLDLCQLLSAGAGCEGGEAALEALERRGLDALEPQLRVQAQLQRQLAAEPQPHLLYRWIKTNVEASVRGKGAFVSTLVRLVAAHVTAAAGSGAGADKAALEREKALFAAYAPLLTALLQGRAELQLAAVYAVQLHAHSQRYPKGLLLRWFMYLYNLEVCEEDAFLRWREDVTDHYPGKGEALFQVNAWLTWLQQQESEEEEAED